MKTLLTDRLEACKQCAALFRANVALVVDDDGMIKDNQIPAIIELLNKVHVHHNVH